MKEETCGYKERWNERGNENSENVYKKRNKESKEKKLIERKKKLAN